MGQYLVYFLINLMLGTMLYNRCLPKEKIMAKGIFLGQPLQTTVDHQLAKEMVENPGAMPVKKLFNRYKDHKINTSTLSEIGKEYSNDVATFYFLHRLYNDSINKYCQDTYRQGLANKDETIYSALEGYHIVFVPGLAYKEDTTTGANFSRQRKLFDHYNISNELIETEEWGLSEHNANIIADRLKSINGKYKKIMVVSASKGGLETALALDGVEEHEISSVKSWVSVGGILRGSPIADTYLKAPKCWMAGVVLWTKGKHLSLVEDLSYKRRTSKAQTLRFPGHIKIIHYVGTPLATKISKEIKGRYCSMARFGPNDGLTPIADEITEQGFVVSELGLDHYYRDNRIDKKTLALAYVAVTLEEQ